MSFIFSNRKNILVILMSVLIVSSNSFSKGEAKKSNPVDGVKKIGKKINAVGEPPAGTCPDCENSSGLRFKCCDQETWYSKSCSKKFDNIKLEASVYSSPEQAFFSCNKKEELRFTGIKRSDGKVFPYNCLINVYKRANRAFVQHLETLIKQVSSPGACLNIAGNIKLKKQKQYVIKVKSRIKNVRFASDLRVNE